MMAAMSWILPILGILASGALVYYREYVGDSIGEADWMRSIGGVYFVIVYIAVFLFFWSIASLTGTNDVLFGFIRNLVPGFTPLDSGAPTI